MSVLERSDAAIDRGRNPGGWFIDRSLSGGGAMIDHTVHVTDLMRWLLQDEVKDVYAEISNGIGHHDFDDVAFLTMSFRQGAFCGASKSTLAPAPSTRTVHGTSCDR